jgi:flavodoxin
MVVEKMKEILQSDSLEAPDHRKREDAKVKDRVNQNHLVSIHKQPPTLLFRTRSTDIA